MPLHKGVQKNENFVEVFIFRKKLRIAFIFFLYWVLRVKSQSIVFAMKQRKDEGKRKIQPNLFSKHTKNCAFFSIPIVTFCFRLSPTFSYLLVSSFSLLSLFSVSRSFSSYSLSPPFRSYIRHTTVCLSFFSLRSTFSPAPCTLHTTVCISLTHHFPRCRHSRVEFARGRKKKRSWRVGRRVAKLIDSLCAPQHIHSLKIRVLLQARVCLYPDNFSAVSACSSCFAFFVVRKFSLSRPFLVFQFLYFIGNDFVKSDQCLFC